MWNVKSGLFGVVALVVLLVGAAASAGQAGALEPYRGSAVVADLGVVPVGTPVGLKVVVFDELSGAEATVQVFDDPACTVGVASRSVEVSGFETPVSPVSFEGPGVFYATSTVNGGPTSTCAELVEVVASAELSVKSGGDRVRVTSTVAGVGTAVLRGEGCKGGAVGAVQWAVPSGDSVSPVLRPAQGLRAESVEVTISGDDGRSVSKCADWESAAETPEAPATTRARSAPVVGLADDVLAAAPASRSSTTTTTTKGAVAKAGSTTTTPATAAKGATTATLPASTSTSTTVPAGTVDADALAETGTGLVVALSAAVLLLFGFGVLACVRLMGRFTPVAGVEAGVST